MTRRGEGLIEIVPLSLLSTTEVAEVLEKAIRRMKKCLRRRDLLQDGNETEDDDKGGLAALAASAVSGTRPPAGPEWCRGALALTSQALKFERKLCVALDGFTLHAATRAGGQDPSLDSTIAYEPAFA